MDFKAIRAGLNIVAIQQANLYFGINWSREALIYFSYIMPQILEKLREFDSLCTAKANLLIGL